jgi:outer membrane murein-binding lipoprotein Lpp
VLETFADLNSQIDKLECDTNNKLAAAQNIANQAQRLLLIPEGNRPGAS